MKPLVILKTGDSRPSIVARRGDFEDWILAAMGAGSRFSVSVVAVHQGEPLPEPEAASGIVITGSHAMVTDRAEWIEKTALWLREAVGQEIPVLGICFGHQILAHALGGRVGPIPGGPEYGTVTLSLTADADRDPLFGGLPRAMGVQTSHYQAVLALPENAVLLGSTKNDPNSAFRRGRCAWGVQFHPEYDTDIAAFYIRVYEKEMRESQPDAVVLPADCRETEEAGTILRRFADFVADMR